MKRNSVGVSHILAGVATTLTMISAYFFQGMTWVVDPIIGTLAKITVAMGI